MKIKLQFLLTILGISLCLPHLAAQNRTDQVTRILFLVDASSSMKKSWGTDTKWNIAKKILTEIADSLDDAKNVEIGLRVYGHQSSSNLRDCKDSKLEVSIGRNNAAYIKQRMADIQPKGITPIAYSLEKAALDFPNQNGRNILILITDGEESCSGDPCQVSFALQKQNSVLKPFIIGLDIPKYAEKSFECMGTLNNTPTPEEFKTNLDIILNRALSQTSLQVNLMDINNKPSETNVNMTFYDSQNNIAKYNFYHTINAQGNPDTLFIDPVNIYNLKIHSIPPVIKENIQLEVNKHNIINVPAPQGSLELQLLGKAIRSDFQEKIKGIVKKDNDYKTLHVQPFNSREKYLVGTYDVELLTLPRIKLDDVKIDQTKITSIQIPSPGMLTLNKSFEVYGSIFIVEQNRMKKIYQLHNDSRQENVALQPGKYRIVYRPKFSKTMHTTIDKEFEIVSGGATNLKL